MPRGRPPLKPLPDWPTLMTSALAARYLSVDEHSLRLLARAEGVFPVIPLPEVERWRRSDLDRLVRGLPNQTARAPSQPPAAVEIRLSDADLDRIAARVRPGSPPTDRKAYSIKDAAAACGLGRSTLYSLIKAVALKPIRIGGRRLIPADQIDSLASGGSS